MGKISQAIGRVFGGGAKSFLRFPASMLCALIAAVAASVLTQLESTGPVKLFDDLLLASAIGIVWGMALAVLGTRLSAKALPFVLTNIASAAASIGLFFYLQQLTSDLPAIVAARLLASVAIAFLAFLIIIAHDVIRSDFNQSAFITLKSFLIAGIYFLVIMLGLFFVAFTVEQLLIHNLDSRIYSHIAIWAGLLGIAFFLGYFPSFRKNEDDPHLEVAQKQPTFIEVLFAYVMVPIMFILTFVLLAWGVKILLDGSWPDFGLLTGIFSAYTLFGIFLTIMLAHYTQGIATLFKKAFPIAALIFLAFEAVALYLNISAYGIKSNAYAIALIWLFTLFSVLVLMIRPVTGNRLTAWAAAILILLSVLPFCGYQSVTTASQTARLQTLLVKYDMIVDNRIVTAPATISDTDKLTITDAAFFLMSAEFDGLAKAPWADDQLSSQTIFADVFGFQPVFYLDPITQPVQNPIYLYLSTFSADIAGYQHVVHFNDGTMAEPVTIVGTKGTYTITLVGLNNESNPAVIITRDGSEVIRQPLIDWLQGLVVKYQDADNNGKSNTDMSDLVIKAEQNGLKAMIVFQNVSVSFDQAGTQFSYIVINSIYLAE